NLGLGSTSKMTSAQENMRLTPRGDDHLSAESSGGRTHKRGEGQVLLLLSFFAVCSFAPAAESRAARLAAAFGWAALVFGLLALVLAKRDVHVSGGHAEGGGRRGRRGRGRL